jgi:hypothetical protein
MKKIEKNYKNSTKSRKFKLKKRLRQKRKQIMSQLEEIFLLQREESLLYKIVEILK